jgi:hypothetical protein
MGRMKDLHIQSGGRGIHYGMDGRVTISSKKLMVSSKKIM